MLIQLQILHKKAHEPESTTKNCVGLGDNYMAHACPKNPKARFNNMTSSPKTDLENEQNARLEDCAEVACVSLMGYDV